MWRSRSARATATHVRRKLRRRSARQGKVRAGWLGRERVAQGLGVASQRASLWLGEHRRAKGLVFDRCSMRGEKGPGML